MPARKDAPWGQLALPQCKSRTPARLWFQTNLSVAKLALPASAQSRVRQRRVCRDRWRKQAPGGNKSCNPKFFFLPAFRTCPSASRGRRSRDARKNEIDLASYLRPPKVLKHSLQFAWPSASGHSSPSATKVQTGNVQQLAGNVRKSAGKVQQACRESTEISGLRQSAFVLGEFECCCVLCCCPQENTAFAQMRGNARKCTDCRGRKKTLSVF